MIVHKIKVLYLLTIVAVMASLTMPTVAYAQDETPPVEPVVTEGGDPPVDENEPPEAADPIKYDPANEMTAEEAAAYLIPDNTSVVVVDENGDSVSLATQMAADALYTGTDPRWCPGSQNPHDSLVGCSGGFASLSALMVSLRATYGTYYAGGLAADGVTLLPALPNGTIWIESGTFKSIADGGTEGSSIFINGFDPTLTPTYNDPAFGGDGSTTWTNPYNDAYANLTIQGGWNNASGSIGTNSTFEVPITIFWGGNLTINNINITKGAGVATLNPNILDPNGDPDGAGPMTAYSNFNNPVPDPIVGGAYDSYALQVVVHDDRPAVVGDRHDRTLTINNVSVNKSTGSGARFTADGAVNMGGAKNEFNSNAGNGLTVDTIWAPMSLNNVTASYNTSYGASLSSQYGSISVGGKNTFNNNLASGVVAMTDSRNICTGGYTIFGDCAGWTTRAANISLNNVTATSNKLYGGYFQTGGYGIYTQFGAGVDFHTPYRYGDYRADSATNWLNNDGTTFVNLPPQSTGNDHFEGSYVTTGRGSISLTGTNIFNSNNSVGGNEGLYAHTWIGDIYMENVTADSNTNSGADLSIGDNIKDSAEGGGGTITLAGTNSFSNNQNGDGLNAWTFSGNINVNNTHTDSNRINGATLTIGDYGYWNPNAYSVWAINPHGRTDIPAQPVQVGYLDATTDYVDVATGHWVYLNSGTHTEVFNRVGGWVTGGGDINITTTDTGTGVNKVIGTNTFSSNSSGYGLHAHTAVGDEGLWNPGSITANNITADANGLYGAYLNAPQYTATNKVNDTDKVDDSTWSNGSGNTLHNTAKWAPGESAAGFVTVTGTNSFTNNGTDNNAAGGGYGVNIWADNSIVLYNATADTNGEYGGDLYSDNGSIDVNGTNSNFSANGQWGAGVGGWGLLAATNGAVPNVHTYVWNLSANDNNQYGAQLLSMGAGSDAGVWGTRSNFTENDLYGLLLQADDEVQADNITADYNGALVANWGAQIYSVNGSITGIGKSYFRHNTEQGLSAQAGNNISLTQVVADYNTLSGATMLAETGSISVKGGTNSSFSYNGFDNGKGASTNAFGLLAQAGGSITLTNVLTADYNNNYGASLNAGDNTTTVGQVNVTGSGFSHNGTWGLQANADGDITLSATDANVNGTYGATLQSATGNVTVGCMFDGNKGGNGLTVTAYKNITLNNTEANSNSQNGAELSSITGNVSVKSSTFNENTQNGLVVTTDAAGAIIYVYKSFGIGNHGNGFVFNGVPSADITIECSEFTADAVPDINIANASGSTTLLGVTYGTSNITGALFTPAHDCNPVDSGGDGEANPVVVVPPAAVNDVITYEPVLGDGKYVDFSCDAWLGLELNTKKDNTGDFVRLPCGLGEAAMAKTLAKDKLPLAEPEGFVKSLTYEIKNFVANDVPAFVGFRLPDGETGDGYQIMFWDEKAGKWMDLDGEFFADGYFQIAIDANAVGTYILVKR